MAKRKQTEHEEKRTARYEEQPVRNTVPGRIIAAILLFGAAALLLYINLAAPQTGTAMGAIRDVMRGVGGSLSIVLPVMLAWFGALCVRSLCGKKTKIWRVILQLFLFELLFIAVHLFSTGEIIQKHMTLSGYENFVSRSYQYGAGGGFLGAIGSYYLFQGVGAWGGLLIVLLAALILCTGLGYVQRFVRFIRGRAQEGQHRADQRRKQKTVEHMFEYDEFDEYDAPRPVQPQPQPRQPAARPRVEPQPRRRTGERPDHIVSQRVDEPEQSPRMKRAPRAPSRQKLYQETVEPELAEKPSLEDQLEIPSSLRKIKEKRKVEPAEDGVTKFGTRPVKSQRKAPEPSEAKSESREEPATEPKAGDADELFTVQKDDESFTPENYHAPKPKKKAVVEGVRPLGVEDGDYTIVPEKYEMDDPDEEEPPFDMPKPMPRKGKKTPDSEERFQPESAVEQDEDYNYPPIDLLAQSDGVSHASKEVDREKAEKLISTLRSFGIETRLIGIAHGPAVTRFELQPAAGVKVSRITSLSDDIALNLAAMSVRIEAPIPGKSALGVEIPNDKVEMVRLRDVLESADARRHPSRIAVGLGKDNSGRYIVGDIAKMPHVLIAGQTGSGKSVCINSIISSILYRATPDEVRLILIDPKVVELSIYNDIPHLIAPVVTDPKKAASALDWAVAEMMRRYKCFAERSVRDIKGYNKALEPGEKIMPQMVIIIDELADLMMVCPGEVEDSICRLAQLARAAGIHLVIATQRPSVNVITGIIKANIPTRIAFSVTSSVDSRTIIDHGGAEKLLGNGDMLFVPAGVGKPMRVQGAWVSDDEVNAIVSYIKARTETTYDEDVIEKIENALRSDAEKEEIAQDYDPKLEEAVEIVVEMGQASVSMLQRRMRVGYARAGRLIDEMERRGIVSEADGAKPRAVLISREQFRQMFDADEDPDEE